MISKINSLNSLPANALPNESTPIPAMPQLSLNQMSREAPSLDNRVSKKSRVSQPVQAVHYPPDDVRSYYEGCVLNNKYHGFGLLINKNGSRYQGEFKEGLMHGTGIYFYSPSRSTLSLEGKFVHGEPVFGTILFKGGELYSGSLKNWQFDGEGTYFFSNGAKYVGGYKNGLKHGKGIYNHPSHHIIEFDGEFVDGKPINGKMLFKSGALYSGAIKNWQFEGHGTYTHPNGSKFTGEFIDGARNGWGTLTGPLGHYEGLWENDTLDFMSKLKKIP